MRLATDKLTNYLVLAIILLLFAFASSAKLRIQNKRVSEEFKVLKTDAARLKSLGGQLKNRQQYHRLISKLHRFVKSHPKNEHVLSAMISVAQLYENLAKKSKNAIYWSKAASSYEAVALKFPKNRDAAKAFEKAIEVRTNYLSQKPKMSADRKTTATRKRTQKPIRRGKVEAGKVKRSRVRRRVLDVKKSEGQDELKILLKLDGKVKVNSGEIPANSRSSRRFFVDLTPALVPKKIRTMDIGKMGLKKIRSGQFKRNTARFVFELEKGATLLPFSEEATDNVVFGVRKKPEKLAKKTTQPARKWTPKPGLLAPRLKRVVIDPGHGGSDPGALSPSGVKEKTLTLAISRKIAQQIRKQLPGVEVFMTRNSDKSVSLSERTDYANRLNADLFISVHINSSKNRQGEGIETYYLDITHDRYALRLSARENATSEEQITDLEYILADLAMKSNTQESIRLGESVQRAMLTKVQRTWRDAKDLGLKHALFYVLLGAKMPAVLLETSFISNKKEEGRLKSKRYQNALALGVVRGIKRYAEEKQASYVP